jgi:DNA repair exonuclease SbcCD ATPase subunit
MKGDGYMEIRLNRLTLENFKGIRSFELEPGGQDITVRGANAAGKTTLQDGFLWLLFGKDSQGKSDFAIKTLDAAGQEIHGLDHSVSAELDVDGKAVQLKKVYREKWTKKRGSTNKELTGHTTEHFIEGVPVQKKEWDKRIGELVDESTFKLLTSPSYFNQLHWEKRRQILLQVCGDISDQDVIASNTDLAKLPDLLGNRSLEDHKKVVAARKKDINKRLQDIPGRIDELSRSTQATDQYSPRMIKDRIQELEQKIEQAKASNGKADLYRQKSELEAELSRLQHEDEQALRKRTQTIQDSIDQLTRERKDSAYELQSAQSKIKEIEQSRDRWTEQIEKLRAEYRELAAQEASVDGTCPTCGQELPEDQVQTAKDKFNQDKAARLKEINAEGKRIKGDVDQATQKIEELSVKTDKLDSKIAGLDQQIEAKQQELELTKNQPGPNTEVIALAEAEIRRINDQLSQDIGVDTSTMEQELEAERSKLAQVEAAKQSKARIEELKAEEKKLAKEYEDLESQTYLMEQFVVSKVHMLEEKINSKFEMARFKMFKENLNGGLEETCQVTFGGVPVGYGLNTGATIAVGMDIVRTLQTHYGIHCPIWIDNRESLVELPSMDCQVLSLVVDGSCPELTVETSTQYAEAING